MQKRNILLEDKRLGAFLTKRFSADKYTQLVRSYREAVPVKIYVSDPALKEIEILSGYESVRLRDLMDGLACFYRCEWRYSEKIGYELISGKRRKSNGVSNESAKGVRHFCDELAEKFEDLSPLMQRELASGQGINMTKLPDSVYNDFLSALKDEYNKTSAGLKPGESALNPSQISRSDISVRMVPKDKDNLSFDMKYSCKWNGFEVYSGASTGVNNKKKDQVDEKDWSSGAFYIPEFERKSDSEVKSLPFMSRIVEINLRKAGLDEVCRTLCDVYKVPVMTDAKRFLTQRRDVKISPMPLYRAIKVLEGSFPGTEIEVRKSGMLLVRGPRNPARYHRNSTTPNPE